MKMKMLKQKTKDIVSLANIPTLPTFYKPLDYETCLLVRSHPTLRQQVTLPHCSEVDPEYLLYPSTSPPYTTRQDPDCPFTESYDHDSCICRMQDLPGNVGCRTLDQLMPCSLDVVFRPRKSTVFATDGLYESHPAFNLALKPLADGSAVDYLTDDEDSDEREERERKPAPQIQSVESFLDMFEKEESFIVQNCG